MNADKRKVLDQQLVAKGFVVAAGQESPVKYKLTGLNNFSPSGALD